MNQAFHRWLYLKKIKKIKQKAAIIIAKQLELKSEFSKPGTHKIRKTAIA